MTEYILVPKKQLETLYSLTDEIDTVAGHRELQEIEYQLQMLIDSHPVKIERENLTEHEFTSDFYAKILDQYQNQKISGGKILELIGQLQELMRCEIEPSAYMLDMGDRAICLWAKKEHAPENSIPLYAAPKKREPLSDLEIINICEAIESSTTTKEDMFVNICRSIEKHHGICS